MAEASDLQPSTPQASAAVAQTRGYAPHDAAAAVALTGARAARGRLDTGSRIGPRVMRAAQTQPHERQPGEPVYRPLRIYALDPTVSRLEGAVALVKVPYEPLKPGPAGKLFKVDSFDGWQRCRYREVHLDEPAVLIRSGCEPSPSDPRFHQQMVYAVCSLVYAAFKSALGRDVAWGFREWDLSKEPMKLVLRPHGCEARNAYYDKHSGELVFGYYRADEEVLGPNLPSGFVFTCLSHDVIAHEVTHALLDGLRAHFTYPSGRDVLAFHESFADLVAIFQHFSYDELLEAAIRQSRGNLIRAELLTGLARQFGHTTGSKGPLRSPIEDTGETGGTIRTYARAGPEPHDLGTVLTSAVFEAFVTVFQRKVARYLRLASNGTGVLPDGEPPADLQALLARKASQLASQFLAICIRAIDYCPPVDLEFGEYLRALITADHDLTPDDPWAYREALIHAFRRRGIHPRHVSSLSEDALLWRPPPRAMEDIPELHFARLQFDGDPGRAASAEELRRQAEALGRFVTRREHLDLFGLTRGGDHRLGNDEVDPPYVESVRSSRRIGSDGQIVFDLVAEVVQRRRVLRPNGREEFAFYGGATAIVDPRGQLRYVILKDVLNKERLERQRAFIQDPDGRRFWQLADGTSTPRPDLFRQLHYRDAPAAARPPQAGGAVPA